MKVLENIKKIDFIIIHYIRRFTSIEKIHFNELKIKIDLNIYV